MANIIIVGSSILVGEDIIGLANIMELGFGFFPVGFMLVWMPVRRELFVGLVDFSGGRIRLDA